jgi:phage shock protein PspC (stress-responsive transcriptional regulator)
MEPDDTPRTKLTRSTTDKYVWGVSGGLGRAFGIDPTLFRVAFGVSVLFGGIGIVAYIALAAFLPKDDGEPAWIEGRSKATTIIVVAVLGICAISALKPPDFIFGPGIFVVAGITVAGVLLYRSFGGTRGEDPARVAARVTLVLIAMVAALGAATGVGFIAAIGGGPAEAVIGIVAGLGLISAGLLGGPRWLILPAMVLVLPLAVVSAANIDLTGGVGHREYRELKPTYRLGMGQMVVDLRDVTLPANTAVKLSLGIGEVRLRPPAGTCVTTSGKIGLGEADLPKPFDSGGDIKLDQRAKPAPGHPLLTVDADVGVGHLQIDRQVSACA